MGFRNRCQLAGAQGVVDLSVPLVEGRGQKRFVRDVRISDRQPWAAQHWKTIVSCYSRSPWFDHYRDDLAGLYQRRVEFLMDWDLACFDWTVRALGLAIGVELTAGWVKEYDPANVIDWRGKLRPSGRAEGFEFEGSTGMPGEIGQKTESGVWRADAGAGQADTVRYRQVFEERTGFIPNLSILDLLFCEGKGTVGYLGK